MIDDFFSIARVSQRSLRLGRPSPASEALDTALACYEGQGLLGSPEKEDCLHSCLTGAWTSAAMYRRPVTACFQHAYSLFPASSLDPRSPKTVPLPRRVAMELQLVAVLGPLTAADVSVP